LVSQINQQLSGTGVAADINSTTGFLEFTGGAFSIAGSGAGMASFAGTAGNVFNTTLYNQNGLGYVTTTGAQTLQFTVNGTTTNVALASGVTEAGAISAINQAMNAQGIYAVADPTAATIDLQGNVAFSTSVTAGGGNGGFGALALASATAPSIVGNGTQAATNAITAINAAIASLGNVQGVVGAGENKLNYAIGLANSQITSFSAAQSRIRDADMAAEAANLTKSQILEQSSIAAMAQANSAPQAVLALLK